MRDSGLTHILSISGLHMAIMAGTVFWVVRALLALVSGLALRYPINKWAAAAALTAATFYLALSGAAVPMVRSWIKMSIVLIAVCSTGPPSRCGTPRLPRSRLRCGRGPLDQDRNGRRRARAEARAPSSRQGPRRTRNGTMTAVRTARTRARVPAAIE